MKASWTATVGIGAFGLSSILTGCASPDATARLPLPNNTALYSTAAVPTGRMKPYSASSGVVQASGTATQTPPTSPSGTAVKGVAPGPATPPAAGEPRTFTPAEAVRFALENNPSLQAIREQRGFAQGGLVIAKTYPYNPVSQFTFFAATGEGVTNTLTQAHKITMDIEVRGQRHFRQQAAYAALTRTEWDIAAQELLVAVAANRAYNTVLYRQRKLEVLEDTIKLNEQVVEQVKKLVDWAGLTAVPWVSIIRASRRAGEEAGGPRPAPTRGPHRRPNGTRRGRPDAIAARQRHQSNLTRLANLQTQLFQLDGTIEGWEQAKSDLEAHPPAKESTAPIRPADLAAAAEQRSPAARGAGRHAAELFLAANRGGGMIYLRSRVARTPPLTASVRRRGSRAGDDHGS
ncbi:MAG: hypothetical protein C4297_04540 [Gemmataceae bacterium]